jgi:2,3-bisphosphoglycerate-dependent phosphoglycerate mutase
LLFYTAAPIHTRKKIEMQKTLLFSLLIFLLGFTGNTSAQTTTRIFVVRHADRQVSDDLNALGLVRANELKRVLQNTGIDSVFSTNFIRTRKTVQPLADAIGLPILLYDSNPPLLQRICKYSKGKTLLVAGHSNTVGPLIKSCGCQPKFINIPDNQFDNLFLIIVLHPPKNVLLRNTCKLLAMKYGAPTPL